MTRRKGAKPHKTARAAVIKRDQSTCQYCFKVLADHEITIDHRVPKCKGGTNVQSNLVVSCADCNSLKDDNEWPIGFMMDPVVALKTMWLTRA